MNIAQFKKRCDNLIVKIRKDYPLLDNSKIIIQIKNLKSGSMFARWTGKNSYKIQIDYKKYKDASDKEIIGALAHELVHFEEYSTWSISERQAFLKRYLKSRTFMAKTERRIDKETIKRGYGKELLDNREMRLKALDKDAQKKAKKIYMFSDKIKEYAKSIGKWK